MGANSEMGLADHWAGARRQAARPDLRDASGRLIPDGASQLARDLEPMGRYALSDAGGKRLCRRRR